MKVIITAGGTAGHINPAIALAQELEDRGHQVIFAGTPNRLEARLVPQSGYNFVAFDAKGFNRSKPWTIISAFVVLMKSTAQAKAWLKKEKPDIVVGFGSYVSIAICRAAKTLKIPYIIHEQNSVMGMANNFLSKNAEACCLTYPRAKSKRCNNPIVVGNPVRKQIFEASKDQGRQEFNIPTDALMLVVFGGSLGAQCINNAICRNSTKLLEDFENLYVVHIVGKKNYKQHLETFQLDKSISHRWTSLDYCDKMGLLLAACDLCICRAGASTLSEITALSIPSLLVPYPYATENHQFFNAKTLLEAGCAEYIEDKDLDSTAFDNIIYKLLGDKEKLKKMKQAYAAFDAENAAKKLADIVESNSI